MTHHEILLAGVLAFFTLVLTSMQPRLPPFLRQANHLALTLGSVWALYLGYLLLFRILNRHF